MAPLWDETDLDLYVLAAEGMRNSVIKRGIPQEKLFCRGIPVHHRFASTVEKGEARRQLGILDKPTVLIMSVSYTHLDVYKRQVTGHPWEQMEQKRSAMEGRGDFPALLPGLPGVGRLL